MGNPGGSRARLAYKLPKANRVPRKHFNTAPLSPLSQYQPLDESILLTRMSVRLYTLLKCMCVYIDLKMTGPKQKKV